MIAFDFDVVTGPDTASKPKPEHNQDQGKTQQRSQDQKQPVSPKTP